MIHGLEDLEAHAMLRQVLAKLTPDEVEQLMDVAWDVDWWTTWWSLGPPYKEEGWILQNRANALAAVRAMLRPGIENRRPPYRPQYFSRPVRDL